MSKKRLITSALPYVNNVPHLGNIIGCVLSADIYARYCREMGYETLYICATDEYGTATENKARQEGMTPREVCDKYHAIHKEIYKNFNISFDHFGRTSDEEHIGIVQSIYEDLEAQGYVIEKESEQTYCEHDQMFLADRYVEGKCPHCNYEEARGDQCDACGKLLQPTELIDPKCQVCENTPITKKTTHLYIDLPKLEPALKKFHAEAMEKGHWAHNAVGTTKSWIDNGLLERPITRDLKWGVKVPKKGFEDKVFYVWFDAPIGYISSTIKGYPDTWENWWKNPEETNLYQFMAKDNIPFHTVIFPATQLGTGKNWTMLHHINSTEYLNYENAKFSKSRNTGVFGNQVAETNIPVDLWRFYLLYNRPEKSDANFCWDSFVEDINANFIDNIGNLLNRVTVFFNRFFEGQMETVDFTDEQNAFLKDVQVAEKEIQSQLETVSLKEALKSILALGKKGNKFFQDQTPWATIKTDPAVARGSLSALIYLVRDLGILLSPYMPETSEKIQKMVQGKISNFDQLGQWESLSDIKIGPSQILYQKLDKKLAETFRKKFGGTSDEEKKALKAWEKIQIKVGKITNVSQHPSAERLYVEEIDLGEDAPRTIVSGLVKFCTPEELLGKKVLVASNLASANLRGVESQGMVLTAEKKKKLEVIDMGDIPVGTILTLEGEEAPQFEEEISIDDFFDATISVANSELNIFEKKILCNGEVVKTQKVADGKVK